MPIANDVVRKQGDTYPIEVSILKENGAPLDLSGAAGFLMGVASTSTLTPPETPHLLLSGTGGDEVTGQVSFMIDGEAAGSLSPGDYFAEIQFEQGGYIITTETFGYRVNGQIVI